MGATPVLVELHGPSFAPDMEEVRQRLVVGGKRNGLRGSTDTRDKLSRLPRRVTIRHNLVRTPATP